MAEWLVEEGIGEHRGVRLEGDAIAEARVAWPGEALCGQVEDAVLVSRSSGASRGTGRLASGEQVLIDKLRRDAVEGARIRVEVSRPAIGEAGRRKLAQARPTAAALSPAPTLASALQDAGHEVRVVRRFPGDDWDDLMGEAFAGQVAFAGGMLHFSPTPAMLLVDIDGTLAARALALAAVEPLAAAIQRFGLGGAIGIDFPTLTTKEDRRAVDESLGQALAGWPHERTAMNGFGFVQLVARLDRVSLLHRAAFQPAATAARWLLRRAEGLAGAGAIELSGAPALTPHLTPELMEELARRTGREVRWRADPALALEAPHAQLVAR